MKKARSALPGTPGSETSSNSGATDWANLGDGPASLIADLVLARDVADYVRFRAVCRPWRRCSLDPHLQCCLDARYHPRQWVMLDKAHVGPCRRFLNVSSGECVRMDLPALEEHTLLSLTPAGLLLLFDEATLAVRLLNPLTQQVADLPPIIALLIAELQRARRFGRRLGESVSVSGVGVVSEASAVAVSFSSPMALVVAKPGDERWTLVDNRFFRSTLTFAGRFYCATRSGIMVLDGSNCDQEKQPPSCLLRTAVDWGRSLYFYAMADSLHLVDNGGDLMLVHRMLRRRRNGERRERKYDAYRVDLEAGVLIPAKSLGGRGVFMGLCRTLSVSRDAFAHIASDTLYLGLDFSCGRGASFNVATGTNCEPWEQDAGSYLASDCDEMDGSSEPCCQVERMQPPNILDCLSYCISGTGKDFA